MSQEHSPAIHSEDDWLDMAVNHLEDNGMPICAKAVRDLWARSTPSETPQKPIAWRWRIVSTDEIPWLYSTEKPNSLHKDMFWELEPLFGSVPSATPRSEWIDAAERKPDHENDVLVWHVLGDRSGCDHAYDVAAHINGKWIFPWDRDSRNNPPQWVRKWKEIERASAE